MFTDEEKIEFTACDTFEKFKFFINNFQIDKRDKDGNTILHYYLKNINSFDLDSEKVVVEMYNKGININAQTTCKFRHSPLNLVTTNKSKNIFDLLINLGADVNLTMINSNTVLFNVLMKLGIDNDYFILKLINNGANVYLKNNYGVSPISLAYTISNYDYKKYFEQFEYIPEIN